MKNCKDENDSPEKCFPSILWSVISVVRKQSTRSKNIYIFNLFSLIPKSPKEPKIPLLVSVIPLYCIRPFLSLWQLSPHSFLSFLLLFAFFLPFSFLYLFLPPICMIIICSVSAWHFAVGCPH